MKNEKRWKLLRGVLGVFADFLYEHGGKKIEVQFTFNKKGHTVFKRFSVK